MLEPCYPSCELNRCISQELQNSCHQQATQRPQAGAAENRPPLCRQGPMGLLPCPCAMRKRAATPSRLPSCQEPTKPTPNSAEARCRCCHARRGTWGHSDPRQAEEPLLHLRKRLPPAEESSLPAAPRPSSSDRRYRSTSTPAALASPAGVSSGAPTSRRAHRAPPTRAPDRGLLDLAPGCHWRRPWAGWLRTERLHPQQKID